MPGVRTVKVSRVPRPKSPALPDAHLSPSSFHSYKSSLSKTLTLFRPLAGKLAYRPASDDVVVDCSFDDGVAFVEALSDIDVRRIAEDDAHDTGAFLNLVPEIAADEMPVPVLAVQVTAFVGGGAAVGVAIHHAAVDGRAFWRFVEAWAAECRADCRVVPGPLPSHDRAVIAVPAKDAIAKRYLSFLAPNRPKVRNFATNLKQIPPRSPTSHEKNLHTERNGNSISKTTSKAATTTTRGTYESTLKNPSTFEALAAHSWVSLALAKGLARDRPAFLFFLADCRARLSPPVDADYTGNCLRGVKVCSTESNLTAPDGHARACAAIARAVRAVEQEPVRGIEKWPEEFASLPPGMKVNVAGSPRQAGYATDFGWGRPRRVELVSMNFDGEVVMCKGRDEGTVQVSVAIAAQQMEAFAEVFSRGLDTAKHSNIRALVGKL
uniref:Uncharacterized protein n=1 Tax=Ananas comosus var. bracteatus TaxID=296719 RepID=A0A6V7PW65_ANACO|nr:unnamed protein product [Ananas comosus var. bracteatus]